MNPEDTDNSISVNELFPAGVASCCLRVQDRMDYLFPEEFTYVDKAVAKRRNEFSTGRYCARQALSYLGYPSGVIKRNELRAPCWPSGIVGSIAHSDHWCAAAVAPADDFRGIGLDIETISRMNWAIGKRIITPGESEWIIQLPENEQQHALALVFSAKEALYKCVAHLSTEQLTFSDAAMEAPDEPDCFTIHLNLKKATSTVTNSAFHGTYMEAHGEVLCGIAF